MSEEHDIHTAWLMIASAEDSARAALDTLKAHPDYANVCDDLAQTASKLSDYFKRIDDIYQHRRSTQ